ncbi:MAG TPA: F0F1 ATP synthase subunit A [Candidatus Acidoferrales bacterium]|nr:F0F1 ATP synthase subunit A [Candidatus Acidoferrales bacterium]
MHKSINFLELLGGGKIPEVLLGTWLVMGLLLIFAFFARRALAAASDPVTPDDGITVRSIAETIVEWADGFVNEVTQLHHYRQFVPFFGTLFVFILAANFLGLIPGMEPPTSDSDLTFALGTISFCFFIFHGVRAQGLLGYLRTFLGPMLALAPLMVVIEIADNLFRPFSLGVRLYANMFADHMVLSMFTDLTKLVIPLAFLALGVIVCIVQSMVFMILSMAYVRLAVSHEH